MSNDAAILANIAAGGKPGDGPLDTFEAPVSRSPEQVQAELAKMKAESGEVEVEEESEPKKVTQTEKLDEEEVPKEDEKEEDEKEEAPKEEDEKEKLPEEKPLDPDVKTMRLKHGDKNLDVPEDATVKVKVKGRNEFVTVKELAEQFSGKQAWGEKIQEVSRKEKMAHQFYEKTKAEQAEVAGHMQKIAGMLDNGTDPLSALLYLVDLSGHNVHDYTKRVYDHMSKTSEELSQMDEVERELYWHRRELSYLKNNQAAKDADAKSAQAQRERAQRINGLRESQGVSEEQYVQAHQDLARLGYSKEQMTPEAVVRYAAFKPHLDRADEICAGYADDLSDREMDSLVEVVAQALQRNPKLNPEKALIAAAHQLGWDVETEEGLASQVERKASSAAAVRQVANSQTKKRSTDRPESFGDYDEEFYGRRI